MDYFAAAEDYGVAEMICPRCKSSDLADFGEGMFRCNRCGALVADPQGLLFTNAPRSFSLSSVI